MVVIYRLCFILLFSCLPSLTFQHVLVYYSAPTPPPQLEFIQSLASPAYLHYLATSNYLTDPAFLAYLKYLQYWRQPPYNRFLTYPHCLTFLDLLLTNETFRRELNSVQFRNFLHEQQFYSWQYRSRHLYGAGGNEDAAAKSDGADADGATGATEANTAVAKQFR